MKRTIVLLLVFALAVSLVACGGGSAGQTVQTDTPAQAGSFKAGFGVKDIMPKEPVPMAGYSDNRVSDGWFTRLQARAVAVQDQEGEILLFMVADLSFIRKKLGDAVLDRMERELGLPRDHVILSGTHTHASVETDKTNLPEVRRYNDQCVKNMVEAARLAIEDLKPAEVYVGTAMTENLNFVRRYIMDDGSLDGDNSPGTGEYLVSHESEPDRELVMMKFVREGGKDILVSNFQAHPHIEGKTTNLSAQTVGAFRTVVERELDVLSLHWQGAAGNLNSYSRIKGETLTMDREEYAQMLGEYAVKAYDTMTKVETGPIQVSAVTFSAKVDHTREHMLEDAKKVVAYFNEGHTALECIPLANQLGFASYYAAWRVMTNAEDGQTRESELVAWSFGDVAGVVTEFELFDTAGIMVKEDSPFEKTFVIGYAYPGTGGYIPTAEGFNRGGYERDSCRYVPGTLEEIVAQYLTMLNEMHN